MIVDFCRSYDRSIIIRYTKQRNWTKREWKAEKQNWEKNQKKQKIGYTVLIKKITFNQETEIRIAEIIENE